MPERTDPAPPCRRYPENDRPARPIRSTIGSIPARSARSHPARGPFRGPVRTARRTRLPTRTQSGPTRRCRRRGGAGTSRSHRPPGRHRWMPRSRRSSRSRGAARCPRPGRSLAAATGRPWGRSIPTRSCGTNPARGAARSRRRGRSRAAGARRLPPPIRRDHRLHPARCPSSGRTRAPSRRGRVPQVPFPTLHVPAVPRRRPRTLSWIRHAPAVPLRP